ncbi:MAG TPA: ROK family protein [Tepidisphaeraceae bacterium]|nr:ROK family protein [Tepidisphaeraceae bacterium]
MVPAIVPRQRSVLQAIWRAGRLSRRDLHEQTGIRPNTVGSDAAMLLKQGILRECTTRSLGRGRPRVPLEIDPAKRHVIGIAIRPGHVEVGRLNLLGHLLDTPVSHTAVQPNAIIQTTSDLLEERIDAQTLGIGLSTPGFVDPVKKTILFSAMTSRAGVVSLKPAFEAAKKVPVVLENDMHALAARWLLTHQQEQDEDVLLVYFEDGQFGSAILIEGRPNRGCVTGANELGHTRLPVDTEMCFCGHTGCLERICSTTFLHRHGPKTGTLAERAATFNAADEPMKLMIEHLSNGLANAMNFTRANRLVLVSELMSHPGFTRHLTASIRGKVLGAIMERMRIDVWSQRAAQTAETAGWLALASLYYEGWDHVTNDVAIEKKPPAVVE